LAAIANLLQTTPDYLLGFDVEALAPTEDLTQGWTKNIIREQEESAKIAARVLEPGAQQDADLIIAVTNSIASALSISLESHLKSLDTDASRHLLLGIFSKTSRFASMGMLAEFSRAFGLINERVSNALHNLETLRWNAENYPSPIQYETNRHFLVPFLTQILNPFRDHDNMDEAALRADFVLASAIVLQVVAGRSELGDRLAHCHAGLAVEAASEESRDGVSGFDITKDDLSDF
jgi:hypothetical protein